LSGFRVTTFSGATSAGVEISGGADYVRLFKLWIESSHRDGVRINVGNRCEIGDCYIVNAVRDGVRIDSGAGSGEYNRITDNIIKGAGGSGVNMQGSDASRCRIHRNLIRNNVVGITIASGSAEVSITDNRLVANATEISDSGTGTLQMWNYLATDTLGVVSADVQQIDGSALAASNLNKSALQILAGTVDTVTNTHTPTTTEFQADDIVEATTNHFVGRWVFFTSGVLFQQAREITGYAQVGGIGQFTTVAFTEASSDDDTFIVV